MQLQPLSEVTRIPPAGNNWPTRASPDRRAEAMQPDNRVQQIEGSGPSKSAQRSVATRSTDQPKDVPTPSITPAHGALAHLVQALERGDLEGVEQAFLALRLQRSISDLGAQRIHLTA